MKKILISSLMLATTSVFAHNLQVNTKWESDYIPGKGSYTINVTSQENVAVTEDKNACFFNHLGNVGGCTLMWFAPVEGKLVVKPIAADRLTLVMGLEGTNYQIVHSLAHANGPNAYLRLLKVDKEGGVVESVRLFKK